MFAVTELPAVRHDECGTMPVSDPKVGDRVIIHSRGSYREALIEKVGRTNVSVVYTTPGAITSAVKIASWRTPDEIRREADKTVRFYAEAGREMHADTIQYVQRVRELADRVEALPVSRRWEAFVTETRKSVKMTETFQA